jgi:hypothetical protein
MPSTSEPDPLGLVQRYFEVSALEFGEEFAKDLFPKTWATALLPCLVKYYQPQRQKPEKYCVVFYDGQECWYEGDFLETRMLVKLEEIEAAKNVFASQGEILGDPSSEDEEYDPPSPNQRKLTVPLTSPKAVCSLRKMKVLSAKKAQVGLTPNTESALLALAGLRDDPVKGLTRTTVRKLPTVNYNEQEDEEPSPPLRTKKRQAAPSEEDEEEAPQPRTKKSKPTHQPRSSPSPSPRAPKKTAAVAKKKKAQPRRPLKKASPLKDNTNLSAKTTSPTKMAPAVVKKTLAPSLGKKVASKTKPSTADQLCPIQEDNENGEAAEEAAEEEKGDDFDEEEEKSPLERRPLKSRPSNVSKTPASHASGKNNTGSTGMKSSFQPFYSSDNEDQVCDNELESKDYQQRLLVFGNDLCFDPRADLQWELGDEEGLPAEITTDFPRWEGKMYGPQGAARNETDPLRLLLLLWPMNLWEMICVETNRYAHAYLRSERRAKILAGRKEWIVWDDLSAGELLQWIGLYVGMSLINTGNIVDYWRDDKIGGLRFPKYGPIMSFRRFRLIKKFLHCKDNEHRPIDDKTSPEYKLWQMADIIAELRSNYMRFFEPGRFVTVDEAMIPCRNAANPLRVYNPNKPHKFGIQEWSLNCSKSSYQWCFNTYDRVPTKGLSSLAVVSLVDNLRLKGHTVVADRFFGSPDLCLRLKKLGHRSVCTVMTGRSGYPKEMVKLPSRVDGRKTPQGYSAYAFCRETGLVAVSWQDRNTVSLISYGHGVKAATVHRLQREGEVKEVQCPELVVAYNQGKAGVDTFDQYRLANYSLEETMVSRKWWHKLFFGRLGSTIVNAWIIAVTNNKKLVHRAWLEQLHLALVTNPMVVKLQVPRIQTRNVQDALNLTGASSQPVKSELPDSRTMLTGKHFPQWLKERQECEGCRAMKKQRLIKRPNRMHLFCEGCKVYVCFTCWKPWHTQARIEYVDFGGKRNLQAPPLKKNVKKKNAAKKTTQPAPETSETETE